jgi:hypothetical protein
VKVSRNSRISLFILIDKCPFMSVEDFLDILCMSVDRPVD